MSMRAVGLATVVALMGCSDVETSSKRAPNGGAGAAGASGTSGAASAGSSSGGASGGGGGATGSAGNAAGGGGGADGPAGGAKGRLACDLGKIRFAGTLNGEAISESYDVNVRGVGFFSADEQLPEFGEFNTSWERLMAVGETLPTTNVELTYPKRHPQHGAQAYCATESTATREATQYTYELERVSRIVCPGTPIEGSLAVQGEKVTGAIEGQALDAALSWVLTADDLAVIATDFVARVTLDDATGQATSGTVKDGWFERDGQYYCVGAGTYERTHVQDDDDLFSFKLSKLSKLGACGDLPAVGSLDACVADPWLLEKPMPM